MKERQRSGDRIFAPVRALSQRFAYGALIVAAIALMLIGRIDPRFVELLRVQVTDAVSPIINIISRPLDTAGEIIAETGAYWNLRLENKQLKVERDRLLHWRQVAQELEAQNNSFRGLLNFNPDKDAKFVSARVIGDAGGAFAHTLLVNAGEKQGVRKGQAVVTGSGLVGRIQEVGGLSARILLITDLNSRIPVIIESTRVRAVMAGNNELKPRLIHLPPGSTVSPGDRVVTSGHAGVFPPSLAIGVVSSVGENGIRVKTFFDSARTEYVSIFDFGMAGILPAPELLRDKPKAMQGKLQ